MFEEWLEKQKTKQSKRVLKNLRKPKKLTFDETILKVRKALGKPKIKRTAIKKPKLVSTSKLKKDLWKIVSPYIRNRDDFTCFTCGKRVRPYAGKAKGIHAGHMFPSGNCGALLRYHPKNLAAQCYFCNINMGGNSAEYYIRAEKKYGTEYMQSLRAMKQTNIQADRYFYESLIDLYKQGNQEEIIKFLESYL